MSSKLTLLTAWLIGMFALWVAAAVAAQTVSTSGRWEGRIEIPGNPIDITVDLGPTDGGRWLGDIDIPAQGLANFPLTDIEVDGSSVSFAMSGIPGEPVFRGTLSDDGAVLAGELSQGGAAIPFRLERTGDAEIETAPQGPAI